MNAFYEITNISEIICPPHSINFDIGIILILLEQKGILLIFHSSAKVLILIVVIGNLWIAGLILYDFYIVHFYIYFSFANMVNWLRMQYFFCLTIQWFKDRGKAYVNVSTIKLYRTTVNLNFQKLFSNYYSCSQHPTQRLLYYGHSGNTW